MADAVLNGLTNNRHSKFMAKFREFDEREKQLREAPPTTVSESASLSRNSSGDDAEKSPSLTKESKGVAPASDDGEGTYKTVADNPF